MIVIAHAELTARQRQLLEGLTAAYSTARFQPPLPAELATTLETPVDEIRLLIQLCTDQQQLVHIGGDLFLAAEAERHMREQVRAALMETDGMTVSQIRDILETTRKFAVPLCEYLDRVGVTHRNGDLRTLAAG